MIRRLPLTPPPLEGELFTSWLLRLAHANGGSLAHFTTTLTGDKDFWGQDQDRHPAEAVLARLEAYTGVEVARLRDLTLQHFEGRLFPRLPLRAPMRWLLALNKVGYGRRCPGMVCCPQCLLERPVLAQVWRLSFVTVCTRHGCELLERCPHCQAPLCPQQGELGWGLEGPGKTSPPQVRCGTCGDSLLDAPSPKADSRLLNFQNWLQAMLEGSPVESGFWSHTLPLESFDVLHQLLAVLREPELARHLEENCKLPGPGEAPTRRLPAFEAFSLRDRRRMLLQLEYLLFDWPERLIRTCETVGLTRKRLLKNFPDPPGWYDAVTERLNRASGRRPFSGPALEPHLTVIEMQALLEGCTLPSEWRRWRILLEYARDPRILPVARRLEELEPLVRRTVRRYNAQGIGGVHYEF